MRFGHVLAAEWRKFWAIRSIATTLVSLPIVALLFAWLFSDGGGRGYATLSAADKRAFDPTAISLQNHLMAQLVVGVLGVLAVTIEYGTRMIATTVVAVPRRGMLFIAKAAVFTVVTALAGTLTGLLSFLIGQAVIGGYGLPTASVSNPAVLRAILGMGLYLGLTALLGLAVGTLVRSTAAALGIIVVATLILPALSQNLPVSAANAFARYWPNLAGSQIMTVVPDPAALAPWAGVGLFTAVVAAIASAAFVTFHLRDI